MSVQVHSAPPRPEASLTELVGQVSEQLSTLVRDELRLAQVEMRAKAKRAGAGAVLLGGVGVIGFLGAAALVAAVILALVPPLGRWGAALAVGVGLLVIAGLTAFVGGLLVRSAAPPAPTEAIASVKQDMETITSAGKGDAR